ncbi:unnamed protein product [Acanthosepion pharaonis]|uniref:Uncharacterized protein n=1 Tax=Acanthosepion pharaonis TaxID=158019 RepID=A0A812DI55_ACAPH|nr:unnamed protein product [Sepia pharaonis]
MKCLKTPCRHSPFAFLPFSYSIVLFLPCLSHLTPSSPENAFASHDVTVCLFFPFSYSIRAFPSFLLSHVTPSSPELFNPCFSSLVISCNAPPVQRCCSRPMKCLKHHMTSQCVCFPPLQLFNPYFFLLVVITPSSQGSCLFSSPFSYSNPLSHLFNRTFPPCYPHVTPSNEMVQFGSVLPPLLSILVQGEMSLNTHDVTVRLLSSPSVIQSRAFPPLLSHVNILVP